MLMHSLVLICNTVWSNMPGMNTRLMLLGHLGSICGDPALSEWYMHGMFA